MSNHVKITTDTYDKIAAHYIKTAIPEIRAWEEESMKIFREMLPGTSVLVPGCGDGRDSRFLKSLSLSVTSIDLSNGMLVQAKKNDPDGVYKNLDIREIKTLTGPFDGIYASGCLYHITRSEFIEFLSSVSSIMSDQGVLYLNMKIGTGNEIKNVPGKNYPGGIEAQTSLTGPRYYEYYTHEELLGFFTDYKVIKWRKLEVQLEGVNEYWLQIIKS
jgi:SAM-dependent methyltransferase